MRKILVVLIIFTSFCTTLSGCYDAAEVDDFTYVIALGIDKGSQNNLKITIQFPIARESSSSSDGSSLNALGYSIESIEAPSILSGIDMLNTSLPRVISLKHLKAYVFSEELAREGLSSFMGIGMHREIRRPLPIYISKSTAENFIYENKSIIGTNISKTTEFINELGHRTGFYETYTNIDFYRYVKSTFIQPTAILAGIGKQNGQVSGSSSHIIKEKAGNTIINGDSKRNIIGTAVFRGDKMVGELDGDETRIFLMLINELQRADMDIPDPKDSNSLINLDVRINKHPKITTKIENRIPFIHVKLDIEASINAVRSNINYLDPSLLPLAENSLREYIQQLLDEVINKCQNEYRSDIFGFGNYMGKNFLTIQDWENFDWLNKFPEAKITAEVNANIARPGLLNKISPVKKGD